MMNPLTQIISRHWDCNCSSNWQERNAHHSQLAWARIGQRIVKAVHNQRVYRKEAVALKSKYSDNLLKIRKSIDSRYLDKKQLTKSTQLAVQLQLLISHKKRRACLNSYLNIGITLSPLKRSHNLLHICRFWSRDGPHLGEILRKCGWIQLGTKIEGIK